MKNTMISNSTQSKPIKPTKTSKTSEINRTKILTQFNKRRRDGSDDSNDVSSSVASGGC